MGLLPITSRSSHIRFEKKKNAVSLTEVIWWINRKTSSAWEGALLWSAWTAALDRWWTSWLTTWERETQTERGGASPECQCAERKEKLHLGSCCQGYHLSSAAADTQRQGQDVPPVGHPETLETLLMLSWRRRWTSLPVGRSSLDLVFHL